MKCKKCILKNFIKNNNEYADQYIGCAMKIVTILFALTLLLCFINEII